MDTKDLRFVKPGFFVPVDPLLEFVIGDIFTL